nr:hypothetical protein [Tanacetum cinerariifolium]
MSLKVIKITNQERYEHVGPMSLVHKVDKITGIDDQILPSYEWVPIRKSNCVLDVQKPQKSPIFKAFTASSIILGIYIQQFWNTMQYDSSTGMYRYQLDEQWFNLHKKIIRYALQITPTNDTDPFVAPPSSDTVIEYANTLGYPCTLKNVYAMSVNSLYQPWRAILSMINMCLPERGKAKEGGVTESPKAAKVTKPKTAKQTKPSTPKAPKHTSSQPSTSTSTPTEPSKKTKRMPKGPLQLVDEFVDKGVPDKELAYDDDEANLQRALELSLKEQEKQGPACLVKRTAIPTEPSRHAESLSLDKELALTYSESKSDKGVPEINAGDHDKGQARPNPGEQNKGQARSNLGDPAESQPQSSHVVHVGPNLEHIDLEASLPTSTAITLAVMTATTLPPPPPPPPPPSPQPQQSTADQTLLQCIGELEEHTENLLPYDLAQEERLDKHGSQLYKLENLNITHHRDYSNQAAHQMKRKRRNLPRTIFGSPPPQPPPPPPLAEVSEAPGSAQQQGIKALTSSKSMATTPHSMAWTISYIRYESTSISAEDTIKDWWKPLPEEERPTTPEPAWTIPSSSMSDVENNWAVALSSTYVTPAENSLLAKTET